MRKYKIFISGVQKELRTERQAVKKYVLGDTLLSEYFDVFLFEDAPARSQSAEQSYLGEVKKSDIYLGILGDQYGRIGKGRMSATEAEFREAKKQHKNILIYIKGGNGANDKKREAGVQELIKEIRDSKHGFSYKRFSDTSELTHLVYASLIEFLKEEGIVGRGAFDERICGGAKWADIDKDKVRWFLKTARAARKYPLKQDALLETFFTHLDLIKNGKLTNAAILLFGKIRIDFFCRLRLNVCSFPALKLRSLLQIIKSTAAIYLSRSIKQLRLCLMQSNFRLSKRRDQRNFTGPLKFRNLQFKKRSLTPLLTEITMLLPAFK